ncbi:unnamed protein product [Prorocentrum cordatum]|nr:unnamed protein product [Polarella glacialis]
MPFERARPRTETETAGARINSDACPFCTGSVVRTAAGAAGFGQRLLLSIASVVLSSSWTCQATHIQIFYTFPLLVLFPSWPCLGAGALPPVARRKCHWSLLLPPGPQAEQRRHAVAEAGCRGRATPAPPTSSCCGPTHPPPWAWTPLGAPCLSSFSSSSSSSSSALASHLRGGVRDMFVAC